MVKLLLVGVTFFLLAGCAASLANPSQSCSIELSTSHGGDPARVLVGTNPGSPSLTLRGGSHFDALNMLHSGRLTRDLGALFRRKEYEFGEDDEKVFNATAVVMRHVAKGFALHGMFGFIDACKTVYEDGLVGIRKFTGCFDELAYAIFIHYSASAFEKICATTGSDMENLMVAMDSQRKMFVKMRIPLIIRTILLAVQMIRYLLGMHPK